jgi:hypothetical protein
MPALTTQSTTSSAIYALLEGGQYLTITGAASRVQVDVDLYDGSTYRKVVDAAMLGNAHTLVLQRESSQAEQYNPVIRQLASSGSGVGLSGGLDVVADGATTSYVDATAVDSSFRVAADDLIPGKTQKTRTLFQWWTGVNGGGNLIAEIWADEIRGWSTTIPTSMG